MNSYSKSKRIRGGTNSLKRTVKRLKRERSRKIRHTAIEDDVDTVIRKTKGSWNIN